MAKSARSSALKKNNQRLKSKVFGPVEQARTERLNKKLLELAQAAKPSDATKMEVEEAAGEATEDSTSQARSNTAMKKAREAKKNRIEKKRVRKERNKIVFTRTKGKGSKK